MSPTLAGVLPVYLPTADRSSTSVMTTSPTLSAMRAEDFAGRRVAHVTDLAADLQAIAHFEPDPAAHVEDD